MIVLLWTNMPSEKMNLIVFLFYTVSVVNCTLLPLTNIELEILPVIPLSSIFLLLQLTSCNMLAPAKKHSVIVSVISTTLYFFIILIRVNSN